MVKAGFFMLETISNNAVLLAVFLGIAYVLDYYIVRKVMDMIWNYTLKVLGGSRFKQLKSRVAHLNDSLSRFV